TAHNVFQRYTSRISQHVVQHHERGCPSESRFAMKMCPGVLWKCANGNNKSIDRLVERPGMIRHCDPHITGACGRRKIAFDTDFFYNHLLRDNGVSVAMFDQPTRPDSNFTARRKR